jgi:type I restriction enzyme S subunit
MSSEIKESCLGEIVASGEAALQTGPFGTMLKANEYSKSGAPVISVGEIREGFLAVESKTPCVSEEVISRLPRFLLKENDIVFGRKGSTHRNALIKKEEEGYFLGSDGIRLRVNSDTLCPKFISYQLRSKKAENWLKMNSEGTTMPSLNQDILSRFPIIILPNSDQKAISHVLGTLDGKIELNRKINETLEGIAKALFKSWFVDFDPVRAKAEGRPTGLPDDINELFPDSFEESELGEIPSGWSVSSIKDQSSYLSRGISPKYCEDDEGVVVLNQKCIRDGAIDFSKSRRHDPAKKKIEGRVISRFDCLVNSTGVGTLGRVAIVPELAFGDVIVDSHVTVVRGSSEHSTFYLTNTLLNRQPEIEALGEGSTGQTELSRAVLGEMGLVVPPEGLLNVFFSSAVCLFEKRWSNESASTTLSSLRDALLPRLISGELRVSDVEKILEEASV